MTPTAIETHYAGCRFRSKLEAQWAVALDELKLRWEYEPEGFRLPSGCYLPDFRVTIVEGLSAYVEVKGSTPTRQEFQLAREMHDAGESILILQGMATRFREETGWALGRGSRWECLPYSVAFGSATGVYDWTTSRHCEEWGSALQAARSTRF